MRVETLYQPNRIVIHTRDGWAVLVSYQTPVAARSPEGGLYRTSRKWSATTSRHINQWLLHIGSFPMVSTQERGQEFFDTLLHARQT